MRERIPRRGLVALTLVLGLLMPAAASAAVTDTPFGAVAGAARRGARRRAARVRRSRRAVGLHPARRRPVRGGWHGVRGREARARQALLRPRRRDARHRRRRPRRTHDYWDRGLIGLAVDPAYPARPYVYVSYAWDRNGEFNDGCADPTGKGCVVAGRIVRVDVNTRDQTVLVEDYCQQFPSHSVGGLAFGADGALYASGGDGASFNYADERPTASRTDNPCGDPPREGGSIRSQDMRTGRRSARPRRHDRAARSRRAAPAGAVRARGSSRRGSATRSASPCAPGPARSGRPTSAGTRGRRSTASRSRSPTTAGPVTRAPGGWAPGTR